MKKHRLQFAGGVILLAASFWFAYQHQLAFAIIGMALGILLLALFNREISR